MASLKKPSSCNNCHSVDLVHKFKPERWECASCGSIVAQRAQRIPGVCRECGATEDEKKFKKGKNLCQECANLYAVEWRKKNPDWDKDPEFRRRRFEAVNKAKQRSPRAFLTSLLGYLTRPSRKKGQRSNTYISPKRLAILNDVQIDVDFLMGLWESQGGLCALSGLGMVHKLGSLSAISIDRIDSDKGYVPGNVQLVCQWANKAKGSHPNEDMVEIIRGLRVAGCIL